MSAFDYNEHNWCQHCGYGPLWGPGLCDACEWHRRHPQQEEEVTELKPRERDYLKRFGAKVKERRETLFDSAAGFARESGVTKQMISKVEKGEVNPSILILRKLATGLKCEPADLLP